MFVAVMVTFLISWTGDIQKVSENDYKSIEECYAHAHQKEFTEFSNKGSFVFLCYEQLAV